MAVKIPRDPRAVPFDFRKPINGFPGWQGHWRNGDAVSQPIQYPRCLVNVTFEDGEIVSRGGEDLFTNVPLDTGTGDVNSIYDFQVAKPLRLYIVGDGCPGVSTSGFSLSAFDHEQSPAFQRYVYYDTTTTFTTIGSYSGRLYVGRNSVLVKFIELPHSYGDENIGLAGLSQEEPIKTFSGFTIRFLIEYDGELYIGLDAGAGNSKITRWDGTTFVDDLSSINAPTGAGVWREDLIVGFGAATNHIRKRTPDGTWTTISPAAGTVAMAGLRGVSYKDIFYFPDGGANVWSYNGTTLAITNTVASSIQRTVAVFAGFLFYGYDSSVPHGIIGRFDGSTWNNTYKDLTTQVSTITSCRYIEPYRNSLWAAVQDSTGGSHGELYASPANAPAGTYTKETPVASPNYPEIRQLLVY
jgi:hypothetical protein